MRDDRRRRRVCGFVFFEEPPRRSLPRPSLPWILVALLVVAGGATIALLPDRDPAPEPLTPVPSGRAEQRLEAQLRAGGVEGARSVSCQGSIRPGRVTRCELLYVDGDTQVMLVGIAADGELDIDVPYPARRGPRG